MPRQSSRKSIWFQRLTGGGRYFAFEERSVVLEFSWHSCASSERSIGRLFLRLPGGSIIILRLKNARLRLDSGFSAEKISRHSCASSELWMERFLFQPKGRCDGDFCACAAFFLLETQLALVCLRRQNSRWSALFQRQEGGSIIFLALE